MFLFKRACIVFSAALCLISCTSNDAPRDEQPAAKNRTAVPDKMVTITTFPVDGGWGYDIKINDTLYIHQNHVPAINGLYVFATEAEAFRVADVIAEKINNNVMPPTINKEEMQALGVTFQAVKQE